MFCGVPCKCQSNYGKDNAYHSSNYYKIYINTTRFNNPDIRILEEENDIDIICKTQSRNYYVPIIKDGEIIIAYFTFSCSEIYLIFGLFIWYILIQRIKKGLDGPEQQGVAGTGGRVMYDQYGRQVIVVQPGEVVVMEGQRNIPAPSAQYYNPNNNQYNIPNNNQYNTPNYNQYNIPNSNEYNNQINNQ